ncbi:hypothetical protein BDF22DRAFT_744694 [Syncephalis plumigaleata]|nr:hypothetical protein BDF22DRAFT_744694 [Syncephalis plumigaleata]
MKSNTAIASICVAAATLACVSVNALPHMAPPQATYNLPPPPAPVTSYPTKPQVQTYQGDANDVSFAMASVDLDDSAKKHSIIQADARAIAHEGLADGSFMNRLVNYANKWNPPAENVASGNDTPIKTFLQWFHSEGHYNNMVGPYTHTGCARAKGADGSYYWTQLFSNTHP